MMALQQIQLRTSSTQVVYMLILAWSLLPFMCGVASMRMSCNSLLRLQLQISVKEAGVLLTLPSLGPEEAEALLQALLLSTLGTVWNTFVFLPGALAILTAAVN